MPKRSRNRMSSLSVHNKKGRYLRNDVVNRTNISEENNNNTNDILNNNNDNELLLNVLEPVTNVSNLKDYDEEEYVPTDDSVPVVIEDKITQQQNDKRGLLQSTRWTVNHLFRYKYNGMFPDDGKDLNQHWFGRQGIALKIKKDIGLPHCFKTSTLGPCFEKIAECILNGVDFDPSMVENRGGHRKATIRMDSPDAQILANGLESGLSVKRTWVNINKHRHDNGQELISQSCVLYALKSMKPKLVKIKKRKQGSTEPNSSWSQARYAWTSQLLARFGRLKHVYGPIERRFNQSLVGKLELNQIIWCDETHCKCLIGGHSNTRDFHLQFPRYTKGKFDIYGEYSNEEKQY